MGGAAKITLRRCSTAAVYKSIRYSDHRLKTTAAAIIEALNMYLDYLICTRNAMEKFHSIKL
jgi:hypothetical protein